MIGMRTILPIGWATGKFFLFRFISRKFLGLMTQERKSLSLCALCANDFDRLSPRKRSFVGDLARMTREQWRTKCRRRPRRCAESLRSSHAVVSVRVERRVSPAPRRSGASPFLESFDREVTV